MKLATYKDGSRDGQLVVVSRDLGMAHYATGIAGTLQQALDDWNFIAPQLQDLAVTLNHGKARHAFPFDPRMCMAPLPRAYQWVTGAAHPRPVEAQGPLQRPSDDLRGPCDDLILAQPGSGVDVGAGIAVITDDVPQGATHERALEGVRLLMLYNDTALAVAREGACGERIQPGPTAFGPVAVTPDELGEAWQQGRLHLTLQITCAGRKLGMCDLADMRGSFGTLIADLCRTRRLRSGSIVGGGIVGSSPVDVDGRPDWPKGHGCIADRRAAEQQRDGRAVTAYLALGDVARLEVKGRDGQSVFGAVEQTVAAPV